MKVVCLQGSHKKNGNTSTMLGWVEEALQGAGHQIEHVHMAEKNVSGCIGCYRCQQDPDELICSVQDDGSDLLEAIAGADALIYATPLYGWDFSGQMKPLLDRHLSFVTGFMDPAAHKSHLEGKTAALLVTCGGPEGQGNTDCISTIWQRMASFAKFGPVHELIVANCADPKDLGEEHQTMAEQFASTIAG
ncbi:MAG: flavodoxin family protein [Gemmatimonadales bacterium]|nr:flavodoxin family protein [Gemmatimonadales bacterium]